MAESRSKEVVLRPLVEMDIRPIQNWNEFLRRWKRAQRLQSFDEMISLMHMSSRVEMFDNGYNEKSYTEVDRLLFYLFYADGWADKYLLEQMKPVLGRTPSYRFGFDPDKGTLNDKTSTELRQMVAIKAADKLLQSLFKTAKNTHEEKELPTINDLVLDPQIVSAILNFFRIEKERHGIGLTIRNYPNKWDSPVHKQEKIRDFLISFSFLIWRWKKPQPNVWLSAEENALVEKQNEAMQSQLNSAKPWTIEILSKLGETWVLRKLFALFDDACLAKLEEIAMRNSLNKYKHNVGEDRPVTSIDEACFAGSAAAWLLKEHELVNRVQKRLGIIREAENAKKEADRKLRALTAK